MKGRERILAALEGKESDRVPLTEIGIWPETIQRWRREGLPKNISPHDYFQLDKIEFFSFDASLGQKERVIQEEGDFRIYSDRDGCSYKMFIDRPVSPLFIDSSVKSPDDWERLKGGLIADLHRFTQFDRDAVFGETLIETQTVRYARCKEEDIFTVLVPLEPCWYYLRLLGEENALANIGLCPDFAGTIIEEYNNFTIEMLKTIFSKGYRFDALWVFSDLCYKNGMLFSPRFYMDKIFSHQKKLFDLGRENGMKIIYHCDGYVGELLPMLIDAGIDCIQPLEVRAGNDVRNYIEKYSNIISYIGNVNMDIFTSTKEAIEEEVSTKILSAKGTRRYIFHSDHSVPDNVSFENYTYAIETAKKVAWY